MLKKKKIAKQPKAFDIHRNLPDLSTMKATAANTERMATGAAEPKGGFKWKRLVALMLAFIVGVVVFIGVWDARNLSRASQKIFGSGNVFSLVAGGGLKTDERGRVNVLIVGYSIDDPGHAGATLTDSIILLSMNPQTKTGYMLSIPRDLYVRNPGGGYSKINQVFQDSGMSTLEDIVSTDFGMPVGYYMLLNYSSVKQSVDALGGIDVTINSPEGRLYDPNKDWTTGGPLVDLPNGQHHLNGQQALDLTRARGDPSQYGYPVGFAMSDFQRTADQRLIFTALKDKLSWKLILDPRKNSQLLDAFAGNIKTDVQVSEARPLFGLFNSVNGQNLKSLSLNNLGGKNLLTSTTTYTGASGLIPAAGLNDYSAIQAALSQY